MTTENLIRQIDFPTRIKPGDLLYVKNAFRQATDCDRGSWRRRGNPYARPNEHVFEIGVVVLCLGILEGLIVDRVTFLYNEKTYSITEPSRWFVPMKEFELYGQNQTL